jgi:phosphatidylglycerophosphatase A
VNALLLWLAQGFGIGRIPVAPGTFGSMIGLLWFGALLLTGNLRVFLAGIVLGLVLSVWLCGVGEKVLGQTDPGSVVFDEIAAIPLCFLGWILIVYFKTGTLARPEYFLSRQVWPLTLGVFVLFRIFDIWKPWPVRQSQSFSGGWGVTVDDALAAIYVNLAALAAYAGSVLIRP